MYDIGKRYAVRFPELLRKGFSEVDFKFVSSCKSRSIRSAAAFSMGYLKGRGDLTSLRMQPVPVATHTCVNDTFFRYFDSCPRWEKEVRHNKASVEEVEKFKVELNRVIEKVQEKLGLKGVEEINVDSVYAMFLACGYKQSTSNVPKKFGWCSIFDEEDLVYLNYYRDLRWYHIHGPAYPLTAETSCDLLKDIYYSILAMTGKGKDQKSRYKVIVRAAHLITFLPLYAKMGIFLDRNILQADNFHKMKHRNFKVGKICPMSGNLAFVLYRCYDGNYKIQMYVNERLVRIPCCQSKVHCSLEEFEQFYKNDIESCNFRETCK